MQIHEIHNKKIQRKRIGRGGKKGTYSGRGCKGQKARAGFSKRATFEGGSTSIIGRTKKLRGFKGSKVFFHIINLKKINDNFKAGETVSPQSLKEKGLIENEKTKVKILADGSLDHKLFFKSLKASSAALEKIKQAKGDFKFIKASKK